MGRGPAHSAPLKVKYHLWQHAFLHLSLREPLKRTLRALSERILVNVQSCNTTFKVIVPLLCIGLAVKHLCEFVKCSKWTPIFSVSEYLLPLYPGRSHSSESSRHTACSWASRVPRRSRWCTRLSHLWARRGRGCPVSPECRWPQGYLLCQWGLLGPACSCQTGENKEENRSGSR